MALSKTDMKINETEYINQHSYSHLIFFTKEPKTYVEKRNPLQQMVLGKLII
jgi:hypothetical protein